MRLAILGARGEGEHTLTTGGTDSKAGHAAAPNAPFRVVFVCTGNRVRSPTAAALLAAMTEGLPVEVESAGTLGMQGVPPPEEAIEAAAELNVDIEGHYCKGLADVDFAAADLVVGFERDHVAAAVVEAGAPADKTFTLPELARLLADVAGDASGAGTARARGIVAAAAARRRDKAEFVPGEEVADPIGGPLFAYRRTAREVRHLLATAVAALFPGRGADGSV